MSILLRITIIDTLTERLELSDDIANQITDETKLIDVCDDSLDVLDCLTHLEDKFDININSSNTLVTIKDLEDYIQKELQRTGSIDIWNN